MNSFIKVLLLLTMIAMLSLIQSPLSACTIFNATEGDRTLVGNNEDYDWYDAFIRFIAPSDNYYGTMTMFNPGSQGGMNDQGLFYDWNALTQRTIQPDPTKQDYPGYLAFKILRECATVDEVLAMYEQYNEPIFSRAQIQWVDKTGASIIATYGATEYGYQEKFGRYQVSTNVNVLTETWRDWRFNTATMWLSTYSNISVDLFAHILDLVSQNSTVYSNVYDLATGDAYLYLHYPEKDFSHVAVVNIHDELALGSHDVYLTSLDYTTNSDLIFPHVFNFDNNNNSYLYVQNLSDSDANTVIVTYVGQAGVTEGTQLKMLAANGAARFMNLPSGFVGVAQVSCSEDCSATGTWNFGLQGQGNFAVGTAPIAPMKASTTWAAPIPLIGPNSGFGIAVHNVGTQETSCTATYYAPSGEQAAVDNFPIAAGIPAGGQTAFLSPNLPANIPPALVGPDGFEGSVVLTCLDPVIPIVLNQDQVNGFPTPITLYPAVAVPPAP